MPITLAVSDAAQLTMWGVNLLVSIVLAVFVLAMNLGSKKRDRVEDQRNQALAAQIVAWTSEVTTLKGELQGKDGELHALATKLVDERFRAMSHELNNHVDGFVKVLDEMKARLKDGESDLGGMVETAHKLEVQSLQRIAELKDYVREHAASKKDVADHQRQVTDQFNRLGQKIEQIGERVAVAGASRRGS